MRRGFDIPRLLLLAGAFALAACSDSTAPAPTRPALPELSLAPDGPRAAVYITSLDITEDSTFVEFTVTPSGGLFRVGLNAVWFPPHSICEPTTSTYGVAYWDAPCTPARRSVTVRARAGRSASGNGWVHFDTPLRFVPSANSRDWVQLYMWSREFTFSRDFDLTQAQAAQESLRIYWVPEVGAPLVDESLTDPTLATRVWWGTGIVSRRVKHFSGYQVGNGRSADAEAY